MEPICLCDSGYMYVCIQFILFSASGGDLCETLGMDYGPQVQQIYKSRGYLGKESLVSLCRSSVYPYLVYCIKSWGNASNYHLDLYLFFKNVSYVSLFSENNDVFTNSIFRDFVIVSISYFKSTSIFI